MNPLDVARRLARSVPGDGEVCDTCGSRIAGLCRPLDAASLDDMAAEADQLTLGPRHILFQEGDRAGHVFTLVQGTAKLTRLCCPMGGNRCWGSALPAMSWATPPQTTTPSPRSF